MFESLKRGPAVKEVKSWGSNTIEGKAPLMKYYRKKDQVWEEVNNLKGKIERLEKKIQEVSRFSLKIMHRLATSLYLLQKGKSTNEGEEYSNFKEFLKLLMKDWATVVLDKPCIKKKD